jgi:hypothetical protein
MTSIRKKNFYLLLCLVATALIFFVWLFSHSFIGNKEPLSSVKKLFCTDNIQFFNDTRNLEKKDKSSTSVNESGTIDYFFDNFDQYGNKFSQVIEQFDDLDNLSFSGPMLGEELSTEKYSGAHSLLFRTSPLIADDREEISIKSTKEKPADLSALPESGIFSAWLKIEDRKGIESVSLRLGDSKGNTRQYNAVTNLQMDIPNQYDNDDLFPNIEYPIKRNSADEWTDYWLNKGWNFIFWKASKESFSEDDQFDMKSIAWSEIVLRVNKNIVDQELLLDNLRYQDGLQKADNSLGGVWYPPLGRPQYGVFDVDQIAENDFAVKLQNVRQSQYPSNGDHGRMLLSYATPLNFAMRIRFSLEDLPKSSKDELNTWFRLMYDFEPDYDPGHDWFGTNISLEWDRFGLISVRPIERFATQEQEPKNEDVDISSKNFIPKEGVVYEEQLTVRGQSATASLYEVVDDCLVLKEKVEYVFKRPRYGDDKRYPLGVEITGNIKAVIREYELIEL